MNPGTGHLLESESAVQSADDRSFIGGRPRIPRGIPLPDCARCGERLTFFWQLAFPPGHAWQGRQLALFACTTSYHDADVIPEMLEGELRGADVPPAMIDRYQTNFRLIVSPVDDGALRDDYEPRVAFRRWRLVPSSDPAEPRSKVGGEPAWILDDESPRTFDGTIDALFLLQLEEELRYDRLPAAPPQMIPTLFDGVQPSHEPSYTLFAGNGLYFFGSATGRPLVYVLPQGS